MSVVEKFKSASLLSKIHLILLPVIILFHIIGIAIPQWTKYGGFKKGLWKFCISGCASYAYTPSFLEACQAFGVIATLLLIGSLVALVLRVFTDLIKKKLLTYGLVGCSAIAAFSCLITVSVFAGEISKYERDHLDAGFALVCISLIGAVVSAALGFLDGRGD